MFNAKTKDRRPLTEERQPAPKDKPKPLTIDEYVATLDAVAYAVERAAQPVEILATADHPAFGDYRPVAHVEEKDVENLSDEELSRYVYELEKANDGIVGLKRRVTYAKMREGETAPKRPLFLESADVIVRHRDAVAKLLKEYEDWRVENVARASAALASMESRLEAARAEQERRTPKSAAALTREVEALKKRLAELS